MKQQRGNEPAKKQNKSSKAINTKQEAKNE